VTSVKLTMVTHLRHSTPSQSISEEH
jgi:hypothetical protein